MGRRTQSHRRLPRPVTGDAAAHAGDMVGILIGSLEQRWHRFQSQLRRTQRRSSEASVHDLRVAMRRLMATVDMIRSVIPDDGLDRVRRSLRKHLKAFNELRDTHIQMIAVRALALEFPPLRPLGAELRRREAKLVRASRGTIASINSPSLERSLSEASGRLGALLRLPGMQDIATVAVMGAMGAAFARAFELRQHVSPGDPASIHRLRVAFKKCRYMVEVLRPLLPGVDGRYLKALDGYQTRMGDIQDIEVLAGVVHRFTLASRYAPTLSLVPIQQRLAEMRQERMDAFLARADMLYDLWRDARSTRHAATLSLPEWRQAARTPVKHTLRRDASAAVGTRSMRRKASRSSGATRRGSTARRSTRRRPAAHRPRSR